MAVCIQDTKEALEAIKSAVDEGVFVPVLGFDIAASTMYADAVPSRGGTPGAAGMSTQHRELARSAARLACLRRHFKSLSAQPPAPFGDGLRGDDDAPSPDHAAAVYLHNCGLWSAFETEVGQEEVIPESEPLFRFQLAIVRLAAVLTVSWADNLKQQPRPIGATYADHAVPVTGGKYWIVTSLIRDTIDTCHALWRADHASTALDKEQMKWTYVKLLRLASQLVGDNEDLWAVPDFLERHQPHIKQFEGVIATEWKSISRTKVVTFPSTHRHTGVSIAHLIWLEELLKFTLLAGSRAFRTRGELAFALSLDDPGIGIPRMPADPFEIGLLYSEASTVDMHVIQRILDFCSRDAHGRPKISGGFHRALASIFKHTIDRLEASGDEQRRRAAKKQVLITLGMDLEAESAIEEHFDSYRVLVPVTIKMNTPGFKAVAGRDDAARASAPRPAWLLGTFTRVGPGFSAAWCEAEEKAVELAGAGPLIIKLFGSPLHDLPSASELSRSNPNIDLTGRGPNPVHRLVMDELELMNLLYRLAPDGRHVKGLRHRLRSSRFFFFGQDALTWGDRIPYLIVDAIRGSVDQDHGSEADDVRVETGGWGVGRGTAPRDAAVAIGEADVFGRSVWKRLSVVEVDAKCAHPRAIVQALAEEVAQW